MFVNARVDGVRSVLVFQIIMPIAEDIGNDVVEVIGRFADQHIRDVHQPLQRFVGDPLVIGRYAEQDLRKVPAELAQKPASIICGGVAISNR